MKNILNLLAVLLLVQTVTAQQQQSNDDINLNTGGPDVFHDGKNFEGDGDFPAYYGTNTSTYSIGDGAAQIPPSIFHSERFAPNSGTLSYTVPVANGTYTVRTFHNELFFGHGSNPAATANQRVYDILVEGVLEVDDFDLYVVNRGNPYVHTFTNITIADGKLNIDLAASVQRSQISAIAIEGPENIYLNIGSEEDIVFNGNTYIGDERQGFTTGDTFTNSSASSEPLFQSERFTYPSQLTLDYGIPVPNGTYTVRTHHNELYFGKFTGAPAATTGQRVYDIAVENTASIIGFDLAATNTANGDPIGDPYTHEFLNVTVNDGILDISLAKVVENPTISGIEIEGPVNVYINTGAGQVSYNGKSFLAEDEVLVDNNTKANAYKNVAPISPLFTSERFAPNSGTLSFTVPLTNGTYTVRTFHNELFFGHPGNPSATTGQRVYDITVEGTLKVDDFDLYTVNGNEPYMHTFANITVADGKLNIDLAASVERSQISAIAIEGPENLFLNVGGSENVLFDGNEYIAEAQLGHLIGQSYTNTSASSEPLFQSERYMFPSSNSKLTYGVQIPNGTYTVRTHHNELYFGKFAGAPAAAAGQRVYDIAVEDAAPIAGFDLAAANTANGDPIGDPYTNEFTNVAVNDGILNIILTKVVENPTISGIEVEGPVNVYINTGGGQVSYNGKTFLPEDDVLAFNNAKTNVYENNVTAADLFESERFATGGDLDFTVPVENGTYTVTTYHNELWFGKAGPAPTADQRVYDILLEGQLRKDDFDLFAENGNQILPTTLVFENVEVTDGELNLKLGRVPNKDNPTINGVSITRTGDIAVEGDEVPEPYAGISLSDENYILTRTYHAPMTTFVPANEQDVLESITYFDGLGRPKQQVLAKASKTPQAVTDIVTHIAYDDYGRMEKEWLPFQSTTGGLGSFRIGAENATDNYYAANYAADLDGTPNPYSQKEFEPSPLNRVQEQAAPGAAWKLGSGHEIRFDYETNSTIDAVRRFDVTVTFADNTYTPSLVPNGNYSAGELYKTVIKDENWEVADGTDHTTEEFTDKQGRVVLKRTYNGTPHDTYYVYDDFGNLTYVIPPKVTTDNVSQTELDELCYQYRYDHRNRLVEKKLPGKGWEYIVYDRLDRPIMTKDSQNPWLFTRYDAFGRVAFTGSVNNGGGRTAVQNSADSYNGPLWTSMTGSPTTLGDTNNVYYDGNGYPLTANITEPHTINYYDGYNTARDGIAKPTGQVQNQTLATSVQGLPTVSKVRVLDTNDWITTLTAYDEKRRPVYIQTENSYLGTVDIVETELDFAGKAKRTETSHQKDGGTPIVTVDRFDYDLANRLLKQRQELDGHTEMIASNTYDGTGQLVEKKVGNLKAQPLQTVEYNYNIRGWLKAINLDTNDDNDLFDFGIKYNDIADQTKRLYNGNISMTEWTTASTNNTGNPVSSAYTYSYDALNRIISAADNTNNYNVSNIGYDKNGNIQKLKRNGHLVEMPTQASHFGTMDDLTYVYGTGNKLSKVTDAVTGTSGKGEFKDGTNTGDDYSYDLNGNLLSDANKGITAIEYNHFDRPTKVTVTGSEAGTLDFVYAADGTKLQKKKTQGGVTSTTDYAGNHIYENGSLVQFTHPEGHVEQEGSGWRYVYNYTDHLGTVRLSYSDLNGNGTIDGSSEILQERNTYPFGLVHKGYNNQLNGPENNYQTYLGQELNKELGLDWLSFRHRNYIPEIGRFFGVDPIAEEYPNQTPYQFASNNPVWKIELEGLEGFPTTEEDFINGLGYGVDPGDGTAVQVGEGGALSEGFFSSALSAVGDFFGAVHEGISSTITAAIVSVVGTAESDNTLSDGEFADAVASGSENDAFTGLEQEAAGALNAIPEIAGEAGAMAIEGATGELLAGSKASPKSSSANNTGKIYKVEGNATSSGKPYIGRTQQSSPVARGRNARDGRDRTNATVIDNYDPTKPGQGAYKEQKAIDAEGGVKNLDNKRNERTPANMKELEKKYGNGS